MKILSRKLHYFNPGNETAIRSGMIYYTPRESVRKMMTDLALLPLWYGNNEDYVLIDELIDSSIFLNTIPGSLKPAIHPITLNELKYINFPESVHAEPWGLSPQVIHLIETLRFENENLIIPAWKQEYATLIHRQTGVSYLQQIREMLPEYQKIQLPQFFTDLKQIRQYITANPPPHILKMPYSCSGKGVYWIKSGKLDTLSAQWISGALKRQGMVSIEPALDKVCDFAYEFESDGKGSIEYTGLSVFNTSENGVFGGNILDKQSSLRKILTTYITEEQLTGIQNAFIQILSKAFGNIYKGNFGIDMLIYRNGQSYHIHPLIELNLRTTMGFVAIKLYEHLVDAVSNGVFIISFDKKAYNSHLDMQKKHPLQLKKGKISSGYFSLCPVNTETMYRAYMIINRSKQLMGNDK